MDDIFIVLLVGKLLMFLAWKAPYTGKYLDKIFSGCELCLGVWVYTILSALFDVRVLQGLTYIPYLSNFISGAILSFVMWLLTEGWNAKFRIQHINVE